MNFSESLIYWLYSQRVSYTGLNSKYPRAQTFENLCKRKVRHPAPGEPCRPALTPKKGEKTGSAPSPSKRAKLSGASSDAWVENPPGLGFRV